MLFRDAILDETGTRYGKGASLEHEWPILGSSTQDMLEELRRVDPVMAARWHICTAAKAESQPQHM